MSQSRAADFCSDALLMIGQDLDRRGIKTFDVRCVAGLYIVEAGYQSPPALTPLSLHYTSDDIQRLDRETQERNGSGSAVQDLLSLGRVLWAIGAYMTVKSVRLLRIWNTDSTEGLPIVKIEYESARGERVVETLEGSAIYELCISAYKLRKASRVDEIEYTRFSSLPGSN
jgi:hypothetical protein